MVTASTPLRYYDALLPGASEAPTELASRVYEISQVTWGTVPTSGTVLASYDLMGSLCSQPVLAEALSRFRYFRAGVKVTLRINANRFMYGKLMAVWSPQPLTESSPFVLAAHPHIVVDANGEDVSELDIPYFSDVPSIDLRRNRTNALGCVSLVVLNPLRTLSAALISSNVVVTAHAQFVDIKLDGPVV